MPAIPHLFDLTGHVAVVTGGSRGLGLEIEEGLGEAGASLVLCARRAVWLTPAVEARRTAGMRGQGIACDVAVPEQVQGVVDLAVREFGQIDILVNNAGISWGAEPEDLPLDKWRQYGRIHVSNWQLAIGNWQLAIGNPHSPVRH